VRGAWKALLVIAAVAVTALGWGYWHAASHGALDVLVYDLSLKNDRQAYGRVSRAELAFMDAAGTVLANGSAGEPSGMVSIRHPAIGDCRREEREAFASAQAMQAWRQCFKTQSRWLMTWVPQARYATVDLGKCRIEKVPVSLEQFKEAWWLWWVPHPHIGGAPYTYFKFTLQIDAGKCRAA